MAIPSNDDDGKDSDGCAVDRHLDDLNSDSDEDVRRPSEKPVMYEADHDTGESGTAVRLGMEDASAAAKAQHRREVMP